MSGKLVHWEIMGPDGDALKGLWVDAGLVDIETATLDIVMNFSGFDDYWTPFLSGVTQSASFADRLEEDERRSLEECLRHKVLGEGPDRPFNLPAQAWAVRGAVLRR